MRLNSQQQNAILHVSGPLLVLAGAGTGKTTVLTERLCRLTSRHQISPEKIIALTFTNQASRKMQFRVQKKGINGCWIGTFHRLGYEILRSSLPKEGFAQTEHFSLYDEEDRKKVLRSLLEEHKVDCPVSFLESFLKKIKNRGESIAIQNNNDDLRRLCLLYEKRLQEDNAFDLDDLILKPLEIFRTCPGLLLKYQQNWSHFLVDEYQDTNEAQAKLLLMLGKPCYNICFVGDPDQAIYSWRGATIHNILSLPNMRSSLACASLVSW
uniref:ATP-dependent helicase n=1 Tax=Candidatus Similichlamydia epinepheli TaxID=1903953 RepID=UPI001300B402